MSDAIKHECGIAYIRLLKPLEFYKEKYGTGFYGLKKLYLLLEKQHNRGQDGTGVVSLKLDVPHGYPYIFRERSIVTDSISEVFENIQVPSVLLSGHHQEIAAWQRKESLRLTWKRRPDLLKKANLTTEEREFIMKLIHNVR